MFTRTRIPKHTNCVRFNASSGSEAYRLTSLFLQGKGRIANAPEIIAARMAHGFDSSLWQCYITSNSTEWFGLDAKGEPMIVVLHDTPPFFDYASLKKMSSTEKFSTTPRSLFLEVLNGKYGEVIQIPLGKAIERWNENDNRYGHMTRARCEANELFAARLGGKENALAYLDIHEAGAKKESGYKWDRDEESKAIIQCDLDEYFPHFIDMETKPGMPKKVALERSPIDLQNEATVNFLTFGCMFNGGLIEISLSRIDHTCAFLAITSEKDPIYLERSLPMYSKGGYHNHLSHLFVPHNPVSTESYYEVVNTKEWYFTQRFREKIPIGGNQIESLVTSDPTFSVKGEEKFLVKSLKPLGRRTLKVSVEKGFYTHEMVRALFPDSEANAFEVLKGFKEKKKWYVAVISYYKAEIYTDRIIPTENEILIDHKLLGRFI